MTGDPVAEAEKASHLGVAQHSHTRSLAKRPQPNAAKRSGSPVAIVYFLLCRCEMLFPGYVPLRPSVGSFARAAALEGRYL